MRLCLFIFLLLFISDIISAQDPSFSQFFVSPVYLNPAFTGTSALSRIAVNYRSQWPKKGISLKTYSVSYDQLLNRTGIKQ